MSVLLLAMGPQLGLVMETPVLRVGEPGTIKFHAPGAVGPVKWSVVESDLPAEWGAITPDGAEATISTAEAMEWGEYTITVRAVDSQRVPVARAFSVWVEPEDITVAAGGTQEWIVGTPVSLPLAITGGTGVYVSANVASGSLPAGITAQVSGSTLQISGTPSAIADDDAVITVSDSRGAQGATSLDWEVTSPPKILVGGTFTQINSSTRTYIARFNHDGTLDTTFSPVLNNSVSVIKALPSGKIMIGGQFTTVNGEPAAGVARLHPDGTLDTSFSCAADGAVRDIALLNDGSMVLVGGFNNINGSSGTQYYARVNADGSTDTSFGPCTANGAVSTIVRLADGRYVIGGAWTNIGGVTGTSRNLALLNADGTVDASWSAAPGGITVTRLSIDSAGRVLVAGGHGTVLGSAVYGVYRLLADLTLDTSWLPRVYGPSGATRMATGALDRPGGVLAWGDFRQVWNGASYQNHLRAAVFNSTTGLPTSFNPSPNGAVDTMLQLPEGDLLAGGQFNTIGGASRTRIAVIENTGAAVPWFNHVANSSVTCSELQFL